VGTAENLIQGGLQYLLPMGDFKKKRIQKFNSTSQVKMFQKLFRPGKIGKLTIANRIIMAPMVTHYAAEGSVTDKLIAYYAERAIGGTGLITLEASYPRTGGHPGRIHVWSDTFIPGLRRLTDEVHRCGAKIAIEINPSRGRADEADPISASNVPHPVTGIVPRALDLAEIKTLEEDFGRSVIRAREAGFDAVMIHGGSGYLISEFLSPRINLRKDAYGGDLKGRCRLGVEMVQEAKRQGGEGYPVILRLAASERLEGGISLEDILESCRFFVDAGVDSIDVVSGVAETTEWAVPSLYFPPGCNVPLAEEIKKRVPVPVSVAGRINDPSLAEEILEKGKADFIALGRALLADPYFPLKAKEGRTREIRKCLACLRCTESFSAHLPLVCAVNPTLGREWEPKPKRGKAKKIMVIGGGPAGLQAAITPAERGHKVLLMEKEKKLGGQINLAVVPPGKEELKHIRTYLLSQLRRKGGRIKVMHQEATPSLVKKLNCDVVIAAVGSRPLIPNIPGMKVGMKRKLVVTSHEILSGKIKLGKKAVVIGGGMIGCEIADYLAEKGQEVTVIEILPELAMDAFFSIRKILLKRLEEKRVQFFTKVREERITTGGVQIVEASGERRLIQADKIIVAAGSTPNTALSRSFSKKGVEFYAVGDCKGSRKILEAIHEAYSVAMNL
jgi:2,4-dienoyl-CoA reductase-like NADH-dependent reductase (Old Yellow Enzyme family)/thioredoxin reductase